MVERTQYILRFLIMAMAMLHLQAASAQRQYGAEIYRAYINGDMDQWVGVIRKMEAASASGTVAQKLELLNYYYGHIGYLIGVNRNAAAKGYLKAAKKTVNEMLKADPSNYTALSYKGVFIAYDMSMNKLKVPVLGPQSKKCIQDAYERDPANITNLINMGNMLYHAPGLFGGDKKKGLAYLSRATAAMEQSGLDAGNWDYLNLIVMRARYQEEMGNHRAAAGLYKKVLDKEPGFVWVRDELYPETLKKITP